MTTHPLPDPLRLHSATANPEAIRRLWLLFRHDMSAVSGTLPDPRGGYRDERLENALAQRPGWEAWLATAGEHPIAFAVARALDEPVRVLTSFFVVSPARRAGIGSQLATSVMVRHPGRWSIAYQDANAPAARFWPRLARRLDADSVLQHRAVPGRADLPPDAWVELTVPSTPTPIDQARATPVPARPARGSSVDA